MRSREDTRMGLRWIGRRPVETLLLVFGIALGIGATAAGIALAARAGAEARKLLSSTEYREIVVTVREDAQEMSVPAVAETTASNLILTTEDLAASADVPDVQYAYVANRTELRFGNFGGPGDGGPPPDAVAPAGASSSGAASTAAAGSSDAAAPPDAADMAAMQAKQKELLGDNPEPALEEVRGYEVSPQFFDAWGLRAAQGSLFTTEDMKSGTALVVLGSKLATTLFEDGESLGRQVLSRMTLYRIAGILEPTGTDYDSMIFIPAVMADLRGFAAVARMSPGFNTSLHFAVTDYTRLEPAKAQLASWFEQKYGADSVVVDIPRYQAEATRDRASRLVTLILFLAMSALVIAAANVTNILFARALRRRRAVGILKALGGSIQSVFRLFFMEAALVSVGGAAVGAVLSVLMSRLMQDTMGFGGLYVSFLALGIIGAAALVTALDIFPAMQASRVPAAEAIRYE